MGVVGYKLFSKRALLVIGIICYIVCNLKGIINILYIFCIIGSNILIVWVY